MGNGATSYKEHKRKINNNERKRTIRNDRPRTPGRSKKDEIIVHPSCCTNWIYGWRHHLQLCEKHLGLPDPHPAVFYLQTDPKIRKERKPEKAVERAEFTVSSNPVIRLASGFPVVRTTPK